MLGQAAGRRAVRLHRRRGHQPADLMAEPPNLHP
jgi:hypothetical protein